MLNTKAERERSASSPKAHIAQFMRGERSFGLVPRSVCFTLISTNHLGWEYNFIYVTCICNIDGR